MSTLRRRYLLSLGLSLSAVVVIACGGGDESSAVPVDAGPSNGDSAQPPTNDASEDIGPSAPTITVAGKVATEGSAVADAVVVIQGKAAKTAANGTFSISGVTEPYDASIVLPPALAATAAKDGRAVTTYVGLHATSPAFSVYAKITPPVARFTGVVTGGTAFPNATQTTFDVIASAPLTTGSGWQGNAAIAAKNFEVTARWPLGQTTNDVSLVALEYRPDNGIPTTYLGLGSDFVANVQAGAEVVNRSIALASVESSSVQGSVSVPMGYTQRDRVLNLHTKTGKQFSFSEESPYAPFDFTVPKSPYFEAVEVGVTALGPNGEYSYASKRVQPGTFAVMVVAKQAPTMEAPAAGATGVTSSTPFSWAPIGPECVYSVRLVSATDASTQFNLFTTDTKITVPDLSAHEAALTAAAPYKWYVSCLTQDAATANIDAEVALGGAIHPSSASSGDRQFLAQ